MFNLKKPHIALLLILAMIFGFLSILIPGVLLAPKTLEAPLFPLVHTALEAMSPISLIILFFSGVLLGMLDPKRPLILGLACMAAFPILAIIEKTVDITSHAHFPIEFLYYLLLSCASVAGAYMGKELKKYKK